MIKYIKNIFTRSSKPSSDSSGWGDFWGRNQSSAGIFVDEFAALSIPALHRGIEIVSSHVCNLEKLTFSWENDTKKKQVYSSLYRLLNIQANRHQSSREVFKQLQVDRMLHGNGYLQIIRSEDSYQPIELHNLDPRTTVPQLIGNSLQNGDLFYRSMIDGKTVLLPSSDVIHVKGITDPSRLRGYSLCEIFNEVIGTAVAGVEYQGKFFKKGARNPISFSAAEGMTEDTRRSFQEDLKHWDQFSNMVLPAGVTSNSLGYSPKDLTLIESHQFDLIQMSLIVGLPASYLGSEISSSYSSFEMEQKKLLSTSVDPHLYALEAELNMKLLSSRQIERQTHFIEINRNSLINTDLDALNERLIKQLQNSVITPNEYRSTIGMTPADSEHGDKYLIAENMNFVDLKIEQKEKEIEKLDEKEEPKEEPEEQNEEQNLMKMNEEKEETINKLTRSICERLATRIQKRIDSKGSHDLIEDHLEVMTETLKPLLKERAAEVSQNYLSLIQEELKFALPEQVKIDVETLIQEVKK